MLTFVPLMDQVRTDITTLRADIEERFDAWFEECRTVFPKLGTEEGIRRARCAADKYRAPHPREDLKEYYR